MKELIVYIVVFGIASWGSRFIRKRGYPMPQSFSTKVDRILTVMHLIWFVILSMLMLSFLMVLEVI